MEKLVKHFKSLSHQKILAQRSGQWGDYELLDVLQHFSNERDHKRSNAVIELILRSPEHGELVAYDELYFDLMENERWTGNIPPALRWAYAAFAYEEQHSPGLNRMGRYRDVGETYLQAEAFDTGLAIFTRCLEADPADVWTYNILALSLPRIGLSDLAVEMLDRGLELVARDDSEGLKDQFEGLRREAVDKAAHSQSRLSEVNPKILDALRAAMQSATGHPDGVDAYLPPINRLITVEDDNLKALYADIQAQAKVLATDLIRMAFDKDLRDTPASRRAIALLRQLHADQSVELGELSQWLERAEGDWQRELLTGRAGKIGGYTTAELEAIAADTSYHLYSRSSASGALVERVQKCPEQREGIVNFMRTLLTRPEARERADEETFIGFLIGDIEDLDARELYSEIETAYREDRVDTQIIGLDDLQHMWGMSHAPRPKRRDDGLYLRLRCTECGREREHFVQQVMVDIGTQKKEEAGQKIKYDPHVMDREIVCPKCGARDKYRLTPQANLNLMAPDLESLSALLGDDKSKAKFKPHPRVQYFNSAVFGKSMHPFEGLDRYRKMVAAKPKDAELRMRMGNLLRFLQRYPQAIDTLRQAYQLDANNPKITLTRAMAEHDFGDRAAAKKLYEEARALATKRLLHGPEMLDIAEAASAGLKSLRKGQGSPWEADVLGAAGDKKSSQATRASRSAPSRRKKRKKVKRRKTKRRRK